MLSAPTPFSLILFGASGHLAKQKLYPALYVLALKKRLPKEYAVVGFARTKMENDAFRILVEKSIREDLPAVTEAVLQEFLNHCHYHHGEYTDVGDFRALANRLGELEKGWARTTRLAYFSVPPAVFADISKNLCKGNVHEKDMPFRCIVEKPVGSDLPSFEATKKQLLGCFQEEEVYLLDHFLGKEAVRNVYYLRYANPVLERLFKNTLIHHVEITASETAGLEGRAGYFEHVGTFRDMFQSHFLMIAALLTMRLTEGEESFQHSILDALQQFYLPPASDLGEVVLQGQYGGYREEEGVSKNSRTNTYAALKLLTRISRWEGVPFYLRSGKRMAKKETRISVLFQAPRDVGKGASANRLDIILQGEAGMKWYLQTKMGGTEPQFRPLILEDPLVCVGDCLPEHGLLLLEAIHGKKQWYLMFDAVQAAWRLLDPVQAHLDSKKTPLYSYPAGSSGPKEAIGWIGKEGVGWLEG